MQKPKLPGMGWECVSGENQRARYGLRLELVLKRMQNTIMYYRGNKNDQYMSNPVSFLGAELAEGLQTLLVD